MKRRTSEQSEITALIQNTSRTLLERIEGIRNISRIPGSWWKKWVGKLDPTDIWFTTQDCA
ncbi:hypothetical protein HF670_04670 [Acidithiobacillus thiooxidans]|uniref:hypothetical protein n=1 Tax=Acidithiobacillus thiooxidans TaxID=930 RepID=UPI001C076FEC|nr:hypothetical protein [Acidithiobacillus thiooxidans]MBU2838867.1 hypothetical protein [Acidithiobacillus thiooxidans]